VRRAANVFVVNSIAPTPAHRRSYCSPLCPACTAEGRIIGLYTNSFKRTLISRLLAPTRARRALPVLSVPPPPWPVVVPVLCCCTVRCVPNSRKLAISVSFILNYLLFPHGFQAFVSITCCCSVIHYICIK
jgi:hypothetical protein